MTTRAGAAAARTTAGRAPVVALVAVEGPTGAELAGGLADRGATVMTVADAVLARRADFGAALDAVARRHGALDAVVVASVDSGPTRRGDVAGLDAEAWRRRVEIPLHRTLVCFQGAFDALRSTGGTMVLLVPTLSLVGAAGFGPWAAVTEGQRALAKAAARAWGARRVTVNCVAVPAALLAPAGIVFAAAPDGGDAPAPIDRPGQPAPALGPPDVRSDVAGVVHILLSPAWRAA